MSRSDAAGDRARTLLRAEIVGSERLRSVVVLGLFSSFGLAMIPAQVLGLVSRFVYVQAGPLRLLDWLWLWLGTFLLLELGSLAYLRGRDSVWPVYRWLVTPLEIIFCSVLVVPFSLAIDPAFAIHNPTVFALGVILVLSALHLDARICVLSGFVAGASYFAVIQWVLAGYAGELSGSFLVARPQHGVRALMLVLIGAATGFVTREIGRRLVIAFDAQRERERVFDVLGQQVSPAVAEQLLTGGGEGRTERMCVMFMDLRGFTSVSERQTPTETVAYLNEVFGTSIEITTAHGGIVNKFLGDGFMALFGPPFTTTDPSSAAIRAALEIVRRLEVERPEAPVRMGIGIHTGELVVGNVGSDLRREYTVIGDSVNLASRIEQLNKEYGSRILASEETWIEAGKPVDPVRQIEGVKVKGREARITLVQLA